MSITIPAFEQFQGVLYPLRGLWNREPLEGDKFVNAEIDWGTLSGPPGVTCVQFQLSGNSPVAFSQIVAMSIDNSRCNASVDFIFPDSGFVLSVPQFNQGVYPVFTNALMFYANAPGANLGDITIVQILNSMPPPVAIQPSSQQQHASTAAISLAVNSTTPVVPAGINGTLNGFSIPYAASAAAANGTAIISLVDGSGTTLWSGGITLPASAFQTNSFVVSGLDLPFTNGINLVISGSSNLTGTVIPNLYYSVP